MDIQWKFLVFFSCGGWFFMESTCMPQYPSLISLKEWYTAHCNLLTFRANCECLLERSELSYFELKLGESTPHFLHLLRFHCREKQNKTKLIKVNLKIGYKKHFFFHLNLEMWMTEFQNSKDRMMIDSNEEQFRKEKHIARVTKPLMPQTFSLLKIGPFCITPYFFLVRRVVAAILSSVSFTFMLMKKQKRQAQKLCIYMFR